MSTGIDTLSRISGISREEVRAIAKRVMANSAKLNACPRHDFERIEGEPNPFRQKYRCKVCGGEIRGEDFHWWSRGWKDGGGWKEEVFQE
ncbi:hypothetical protein Ga0100231_005165 [Opitutaceae bacterium TAV4]|nr:hypothetical protein Ga0100231_005165 [Opitutaceae bacterium TAV4]RRK02381.1 hypothetical protein Ga0100230_004295 [Opitutaceae bacterium TAV3]